MKRRNYTAEILKQVAEGRVAVNSLGPEYPVQYLPRSKRDPQPWFNGAYRYSGRYVHTVEACGMSMINLKTARRVSCVKPKGHEKAHTSTLDIKES